MNKYELLPDIYKESNMRRHHNVRILKKPVQYLLFSLMALCMAAGLAEAGSITACFDCHGMPPIDWAYRNITTGGFVGAHNTHNPQASVANCAACHGPGVLTYTTAHRDGAVNLASKLNSYSAASIGRAKYNKTVFFNQTSKPVMSTCSNVNCHFETITPLWGSVPLSTPADTTTCATCHSPALPTSHSHTSHLTAIGNNLTSCQSCHPNHTVDTNPYEHAIEAGRPIAVSGTGYTGSADKYLPSQSASRTLGSCSAASCHASPYGASMIPSPVWGVSAGCAACHTGVGRFTNTTSNGAPKTGSHASHMALNSPACNQCHPGAVSGLSGGDGHLSGKVDVSNAYTGSPVTKHAANSGYTGTCSSASCHVSPYSSTPLVSPVWGATVGCAACHTGAGAFTAAGPATGSHAKHMALYNINCTQCHASTVLDVTGGTNHLSGKIDVTGVGYTATPVDKHPIGTYAGTCTASACHSDGNGVQLASPTWGIVQPYSCNSCHRGPATTSPPEAGIATNKHKSHMNNYSTLGRDNNLACAECHAKTVSLASDTVITNAMSHNNGFKDYSGIKAGKMQTVFSQNTCGNNYCHSSGQATPVFKNMTGSKLWSGSAKFDCSGCHGSSANAAWSTTLGAPNYKNHSTVATANSHQKHVLENEMADTRGCAKCHRNTVDMGVANKLRDYSSAHLNKTRDIKFSIYGIYSSSQKSCTTYCHSNVQAPGGDAAATVYSKPKWGADNATMTCASCHSDMSALTETVGDLQLGSHKRHTVDAAYQCSKCHGNGYSSSTTVGSTHADGTINLSFTARPGSLDGVTTPIVYSQSTNVAGDGYGTCDNSACHGRATKNWGDNSTKPQCEKCHGSANTARTDGTFTDTAGSTTGPYAGTHVSHLKSAHNISRQLDCNDCHTVPSSINSFGHMTSLPAKLTWGFFATYSTHRPGFPGVSSTPSFTGTPLRQCTNTYCHSGVRNSDNTPQGTNPTPVWGESSYLGGGTASCNKCHMYPPPLPHNQSTNCNACHNHVDASNISFADKSKHIDGTVQTTVDECLGCHSSVNACPPLTPNCVNKELVGSHSKHTDAELFLTGKKLSNGDYNDLSWVYGIIYDKGFPHFACGFCHPMETGTHKNGVVNLDMDPANAMPGTVKTKNKAGATWITTYVANTNVVCNNVYCHSNGYVSGSPPDYAYKQTPNWYATNPWNGLDRCAQCHGNSPNTGGTVGSSAHARHTVASHYQNVYNNVSGHILPAGGVGTGAAHGDPAISTTFNCNVCHYGTVRASNNDLNNACSSCHTGGSGKGVMGVYSSGNLHINGEVNVNFMDPFIVKSRAQLRNNISSVFSLNTSWTRTNGYKAANSYDQSRYTPSYVGGSCSTVSCHNGTSMEWRTTGPLACAACHTGLPQ